MMFHFLACAARGRMLFVRDTEAARLFASLAAEFPELVALCLMPDHVHLILPHADPGNRLHRVLQGYAKSRNFVARADAPLWAARPPPQLIPNDLHLRRTVRYVHLNPCRARLVNDPLAWPFSTHRDRVGFAARPVVALDRDPSGFHRFVSADDACDPAGTPLPTRVFREVTPDEVAAAVSSVFRVDVGLVSSRHPARAAFAKVAWHSGLRDGKRIGAACGLTPGHLRSLVAHIPDRGARLIEPLEACARSVGDPRFMELSMRDERRLNPRWGRYRELT